jgi:hypothetical protein
MSNQRLDDHIEAGPVVGVAVRHGGRLAWFVANVRLDDELCL